MSYVRTPESAGFIDGLIFDHDEHLAEASAPNIFLIERDRRPKLRLKPAVVRGTTRQPLGKIGVAHQKSVIIAGAFVRSTPMKERVGDRLLATFEQLPFAERCFSDSHASTAVL